MIRKLFFLLLAAVPAGITAQVTISAQLPPAGLVQKDQLWNLVLVNNKEDILNVNIRMNLQDAVSGELVMSANTGMLLLNKGVKLINKNDIQPVLYNFNQDGFSKSFLPMGSYVACYQVYSTSEKGEALLGDECIKLNIDPLSPPLLTSPADKSEILVPYPQFSWVPPAPYDMFTNLNYEIIVAEIAEGQSPADAVQQNTPVYSKTNITRSFESYASSFAALQPGKNYAWQVIATNENNYAVKTEVWTFKVTSPVADIKTSNSIYITFSDDNSKSYLYNLKDDNVNIKYYSYEKEFDASIKIKSVTGETVQELKQKIQYGNNFFNIRLNPAFAKGKQYLLELEGADGKKHTASFSINNK